MKRLREWRYAIAALLAVIPALWPLFRAGFFVSDDGRFHIYRVAALAEAWSQGVLHPRLFPDFGFGYGQAVLNFYSPLSYWPGALLALLGMSPTTAVEITIALGFALAALAMFGYVQSLWGPRAGLAAAVVYTYFPYHLADAYVRGAMPEHFAFIFPPLILWAFTWAMRNPRGASGLLWASLAWAGLVLTHNLTALLMAPVSAIYLALLAIETGHWRRLGAAFGSLLLAVGMTAAYWLPVLAESKSVGLALGPSRGYENHLLPPTDLLARTFFYVYRNTEGFALTYRLSWLTMGLLLIAGGVAFWAWRSRSEFRNKIALLFHFLLALSAIFMLSTTSLFLWHPLTPILGHLQYPWRFLILAALGVAVVAGGVVASLEQHTPQSGARPRPPLSKPKWALFLLFSLAIFVSMPKLPLEPLPLPEAEARRPERMWREDAEAGQVGATWTAEFLPLAVREQRWALGRPREGAKDGPSLPHSLTVRLNEVRYLGLAATVETPIPISLRLHQFHLPGWQARIDDKPATTYPSGEMALVTVDVPPGQHKVAFHFGRTPARAVGASLSLAAALLWCLWAWREGRHERRLRVTAVILAALVLTLTLNSLGLGQKTRAPQPLQSRLDDAALLIGRETRLVREENMLEVTLYWFALREMAVNYTAFVHVLAPDGKVVAQHDSTPVGGFTPTTRWLPGEIIADTHRLLLPEGLAPGQYGLRAGLYEFSNDQFRNLTTDPATPDNRVDLGSIEIP
ncbi:MAG: hypothetical protein GXP42_03200 [Chloroflexi bacterium]|nr:hypothetical protein [Chloroflexota bacterium]